MVASYCAPLALSTGKSKEVLVPMLHIAFKEHVCRITTAKALSTSGLRHVCSVYGELALLYRKKRNTQC